MLVPFGTHVVDRQGKGVGTVSRLVLDPHSRQVVAIVVQQGVVNRREIVVPLNKVLSFGDDVRLTLKAAELAGVDLFNTPSLTPMPDSWKMPAGFDLRSFFLVTDGWTESVRPFLLTSPAISGMSAFIPDPDAPDEAPEPAIAAGTPVYDNASRRIGEVTRAELDEASGRVTRVFVRQDLFRKETAIPASLIASVGERITLKVSADEVTKLEPGFAGAPAVPTATRR